MASRQSDFTKVFNNQAKSQHSCVRKPNFHGGRTPSSDGPTKTSSCMVVIVIQPHRGDVHGSSFSCSSMHRILLQYSAFCRCMNSVRLRDKDIGLRIRLAGKFLEYHSGRNRDSGRSIYVRQLLHPFLWRVCQGSRNQHDVPSTILRCTAVCMCGSDDDILRARHSYQQTTIR